MNRLAKMESGRPGRELSPGKYQKQDYMLQQLIIGIIAGTLCYAAIVLFWIGCRWDTLDHALVRSGVREVALFVIGGYAVFMAAYLVLCIFVGRFRYRTADVRADAYLRELQILENMHYEDVRDEESFETEMTEDMPADGAAAAGEEEV